MPGADQSNSSDNPATAKEPSVAQQTLEGIQERSQWIITHGAYKNLNRYAAEIAQLQAKTPVSSDDKEKAKLLAFFFFH